MNVRGFSTSWHADAFVGRRLGRLFGEPVVAQSQIDEARPGNFRCLAKIANFKSADNLRSDFAWRLA